VLIETNQPGQLSAVFFADCQKLPFAITSEALKVKRCGALLKITKQNNKDLKLPVNNQSIAQEIHLNTKGQQVL